MKEKRTELEKAIGSLHLWAQGIQGRAEILERDAMHLQRERERHEIARAAAFKLWLETHGYSWCWLCDKILMPWMAGLLYVETWTLDDELLPRHLLHSKIISVCKGCQAKMLRRPERSYEMAGLVELLAFEVVRLEDGRWQIERKTAETGITRTDTLPAALPQEFSPLRVSDENAGIARLPPPMKRPIYIAFDEPDFQ